MRYGLPLPERKQKFNELLADKQANALTKYDVHTVNGNVLYEVYHVSVDLPKYRLDNTRTLALQEQYLYDHGLNADYFTDVESDEVQEIQHGFLSKLAESSDKEKDLYAYFSANTQTEPLILTHDGFVISGNRRLSTFRELVEKNYDKYKHFTDVRVVILPNLDPAKIDQIEDFLEQQPDIKADFSWVARALGYRRRMKKYKYSDEKLAEISGQKPGEINSLINKLDIADRYLESISKPKDYNQILDDSYAFEKIVSCLNNKEKVPQSRKIAFEKLAFMAIKNKNSFSDRMYKNIPVMYEAQAAIQAEIKDEFEAEIAKIEQQGNNNPTLAGLPLFPDPTLAIIKLIGDPTHEEKIVQIVTDKIEEYQALERDKKKKSSVLDKVRKANTLLIEANTVKGPETDKKGIAHQINNLEKEMEKLKAWLNS